MSRLTSTTHAELEKINSTAAFIRQILILQGHGPFQWLYATLMSALQFIMRGLFSLSVTNINFNDVWKSIRHRSVT